MVLESEYHFLSLFGHWKVALVQLITCYAHWSKKLQLNATDYTQKEGELIERRAVVAVGGKWEGGVIGERTKIYYVNIRNCQSVKVLKNKRATKI